MLFARMTIRSLVDVRKAIGMRVWIHLVFRTGDRYSVGIPPEVWHLNARPKCLTTELKLAGVDLLVPLDAVGTVSVLSILVSIDENVCHLGMTKRNVVLTEFLRVARFWKRVTEGFA